jgi:hypothetical protein
MNEEPHTHNVRLSRSYAYIDEGGWTVEYGDTTAHVWSWFWNRFAKKPPSARAVRVATRRAIRKHNRGSRTAGSNAVDRRALQTVAEQAAAKETW